MTTAELPVRTGSLVSPALSEKATSSDLGVDADSRKPGAAGDQAALVHLDFLGFRRGAEVVSVLQERGHRVGALLGHDERLAADHVVATRVSTSSRGGT